MSFGMFKKTGRIKIEWDVTAYSLGRLCFSSEWKHKEDKHNAEVLSFGSKKDGRKVNTEKKMYVFKFRQLTGQNNDIRVRCKLCKV
jgi:hypothetical protein